MRRKQAYAAFLPLNVLYSNLFAERNPCWIDEAASLLSAEEMDEPSGIRGAEKRRFV